MQEEEIKKLVESELGGVFRSVESCTCGVCMKQPPKDRVIWGYWYRPMDYPSDILAVTVVGMQHSLKEVENDDRKKSNPDVEQIKKPRYDYKRHIRKRRV